MKAKDKYKIIFHIKDGSLSKDAENKIIKEINDFHNNVLVIFGNVDIHILPINET